MAPFFVLFAVVAVFCIRVALHHVDTRRITEAAEAKGWQGVRVDWAPFAPGWWFEKGERHYQVSYRDEEGLPAERYCKTSLMTGVFWRDR